MLTLCVIASAGGVLATLSFIFLVLTTDGNGRSIAPRWAVAVLIFIAFIGAGSCAAEDRICEVAGLEP